MLLEHSLDILTVLEPDGTWRYTSPAGTRLLGYPRGFDPEGGVFSLVHPDDVAVALEAFAELVDGTRTHAEPSELRVRAADGDYRILETFGRDLRDDPEIRGLVLNSLDITDRRRAEDALRREERRFRCLVAHASEYTLVWDSNFELGYVSPSVTRATNGYLTEGTSVLHDELVHPGDYQSVEAEFLALIAAPPASSRPMRFRFRMGPKAAEYRWLEAVVTNLLADPDVGGIVVNARDITERHEYEQQLAYQATHDPLTGLPNRDQAMSRLDDHLEGPAATTVLFCDLDNFKTINDQLGHDVGDQLLVEVAARLRTSIRRADTIARFGGDEFVIVCPHCDERLGRYLAERLHHTLRAPFQIAGQPLALSASIGIATTTRATATDATTLVRNADLAMYQAKTAGRDQSIAFQHH